MTGRITSLVSRFFRSFAEAVKFILILILGILLSLVGWFILRSAFSLIDGFVRWFGFEFTSWHGTFGAPTATSNLILTVWFLGLLALCFCCWLAIWCFGDRPIHWLTVLLLCVLVGFPSIYAMAQIGLQWAVLIAFLPVVFCGLMVAKLMGFNRFGRWLGRKGRWWKGNVLIPWVKIPALGLIHWFVLLLVFRWLIPAGHAWLLNDAGDWLVRWIWEPFWGILNLVVFWVVQALHG